MELIMAELDGGEVPHYAIREDGELLGVELVWKGVRENFWVEYGKPPIHNIQHIGVFTDTRGERLFRVDMETREAREIFDELRQNL